MTIQTRSFVKKLAFPLFALWAIFVVGSYFLEIAGSAQEALFSLGKLNLAVRASHIYYYESLKTNFIPKSTLEHNFLPSPFLSLFVIFLCVYGLIFIYLHHYERKELMVKISPWRIFCLFFCLMIYIFWVYSSYLELTGISTLFASLNILRVFAEISIPILASLAVGRRLIHLINIPAEPNLSSALVSFGLGVITIDTCLFILGAFGQLKIVPAAIVLVLLLVLSLTDLWHWLKVIFIPRTVVSFRLASPILPLILVALIFASYNTLSLFKPFPFGHDELERYMNTPHLLATGGHLLYGLPSYSWELFISQGFLLFKGEAAAALLSASVMIFVFLAVYELGRRYFADKKNERIAVLPLALAVLFCTLPAATFQLSSDVKVDLVAYLFAALSLLQVWQWRKTYNHKLLFLAILFFSFAFTIKYTLVMFGLPLTAYIFTTLHQRREKIGKIIVLGALSLCMFLLTFMPFVLKNIYHAPDEPLSAGLFFNGKSETPDLHLPENSVAESFSLENGRAELGRYLGGDGWRQKVMLPFSLTLNSNISGQYVDVGFVFLLFLPLMIVPLINKPRVEYKLIAIAGILYWLFWIVAARGVIWYGFPGFIFLLIAIGEVLSRARRWPAVGLSMLLTVWLLSVFFVRTADLPSHNMYVAPANFAYAAGTVGEKEYLGLVLPRFVPVEEIISRDIEANPSNPPKVYLVGKYASYWIKANNKLVYGDQSLDAFMNLQAQKSNEEIIDYLKGSGFKYMVVGREDTSFFAPGNTLDDRLADLVVLVKNNPEKIKVLYDNSSNGMLIAQIL